jgi:hypothetical protein
MQHYFELNPEEQRLVLQQAEDNLNYPSAAIEKDIWICWLLDKLFQLPIQMAFKGGTSLSRIYNLIQRYSEDVDITVDYRNFLNELDLSSISRSQLKKISEQLRSQLITCITDTVLPHLQQEMATLNIKPIEISLSSDGEQLRFYYPSTLNMHHYLRNYVLLEFGIRNSAEPVEQHSIAPLLAAHTQAITLPIAMVNVLSPLRTFWEKATLIHVECHRNRLASTPDRLSRHWYDLAKLTHAKIGKEALKANDIFVSVLEHKKAFFNASYANYDDCLVGKFLLIPSESGLGGLKQDYQTMQQSGFFSEDPPEFSEIIKTLTELEKKINEGMSNQT